MPLSYSSNVESTRAQSRLASTSTKLSRTFERLSSGLRINRASDDPAGLALAENLRTDARIASMAIRNANDGISITAVADAALEEIGDVLRRMAELAEQSANGAYTNAQRSALATEFVALGSEIERIAATTKFNNQVILSNSSSIGIQVGLDGAANSIIWIGSVLGTLSSLGLGGAGGALSYSIISTTTTLAQSAAQTALTAVTGAITSLSNARGTIGAAESRLNTAISFLQVARENFVAAESRIRDADIAQEVAEMVRLQVLQQAGTAVLAQANQQPSVVLRLLS